MFTKINAFVMLYIQAALLILAAVSWLRPLMSPALDSSQYRSLASCHPPCSIRINATHVLQTLLSALCEFREAHCLYSDVPTERALCDSFSGEEHYCDIQLK